MEQLLQTRIHKKIKYAILIGVAASQLMINSVQAEEKLSPLVVTAGRVAEDIGRVSADVTVIDQKRIEQSQASDVAELLRSEAGINVLWSGGLGKRPPLFLRGADAGQTLVLIDGVRAGVAMRGEFNWRSLSTLNIERIEVVRGPQSMLYGSDAMGGVIQIFTRKGKGEATTTVEGEYGGRYRDKLFRMNVNGKSKAGVQYSLAGESRGSDGESLVTLKDRSEPGIFRYTPEPDIFRLTSLSGNISFPFGAGEVQLIARSYQSRSRLNGKRTSNSPYFLVNGKVDKFSNTTNEFRQNLVSLKGSYPLSDFWDTTLQLSQSTYEFAEAALYSESSHRKAESDNKNRIQQLAWQNNLEFDALSLLAGIDLHRDRGLDLFRGKHGNKGFNKEIIRKAAFATLALHQDIFDLHGGLRIDRDSQSGSKITYRLGGVLRPMDGIKLTTNYGTGFNAPSMHGLYGSSGNPNLKPEESRGWDVGIEVSHKGDALGGSLAMVWFDQRFKNLTNQNFRDIDSATTRGLELIGSLNYGLAFIRGNWTFLNAQDYALIRPSIVQRAKESGSITVGADFSVTHVEVQMDIIGPRDGSVGRRPKDHMSGYRKTDLNIAYTANDIWKLKFRVENVEDKKYEEISGYGVPGRATYFGVSATF